VQQHAASFTVHTAASTGGELPRFVKDEFDAFLECGILARGFLRLRCGECGDDKLLPFNCKRRKFCPSCGAGRMSQNAARLVDNVIACVPVCPCARVPVGAVAAHRTAAAGPAARDGYAGAAGSAARGPPPSAGARRAQG